MMKIIYTLLTLVLFSFFSSGFCATIYLTQTGSGSMNGTTWGNAYPATQLQAAINGANPGDQIWVASGTYFTTPGSDRTIAFSMKNGVAIYGSFSGTETLLSDRDINCGPSSILSGNIGLAANTDNSYQVVKNLPGLDSSAVMDGFVITGGNDDRSPTLTEGLGGGILNVGSGSGNFCDPTIRNCVIRDNQAEFGAGIFNDGYNGGHVTPTIQNCLIVNNHATGGGGGIDNFGLLNGNAYPLIINTVIANNTADDAAGAMYSWGGTNGNAGATMYNVTVANNTVTNGNGGGFVIDNSNSGAGVGGSSGVASVNIAGCIIWGNSANNGQQFHNYGDGYLYAQFSDVDTTGQTGTNAMHMASVFNIFTDPQFLNADTAAGTDLCFMTNDDGYQLQATSPCIDNGSASTVLLDLAFNLRSWGVNVDMGAYEKIYPFAGIDENLEPALIMYPNPVINSAHLISKGEVEVWVINAVGKQVMKVNLLQGDNLIDMSGLPAGVYYIYSFNNPSGIKVIRL